MFLAVLVILHDLIVFRIVIVGCELAPPGVGEEVLLLLLFFVVGDDVSRLGWAHFSVTLTRVDLFTFLWLSLENVLLHLDVFLTQTCLTDYLV